MSEIDIEVSCAEITTSEELEIAIAKLSPVDGEAKVKVDLKILMHNGKNYMCIKLGSDLYRNVVLYDYKTNEISSLDGLIGVLLNPEHEVRIKADIEIIQNIFPANMVLVYLQSLKELFGKRGV